MRLALILASAASAAAIQNTDHYPYKNGPCADNDNAAKAIFAGSERWFGFGCKDALYSCGKYQIGASTDDYESYNANGEGSGEWYDLVSHVCPETCHYCEKPFQPESGTYTGGVDREDLMAGLGFSILEGSDANTICQSMKGYCPLDPQVRLFCQDTCKPGCDTMGFRQAGTQLGRYDGQQDGRQSCIGTPHDSCEEMKYGEAEDLCESWGARLCHAQQLVNAQLGDADMWPDVFDKGADYFVGNGHTLDDYLDTGGAEIIDEDDPDQVEGGEANDNESEVTMVGGRPSINSSERRKCNSHNMEVWVHPQDAGCSVGGGNGHLVARAGNGDINGDACKHTDHKAHALCCWEGNVRQNNRHKGNIVNYGRKMLEEVKELPPIDWAKAFETAKASMEAKAAIQKA